MKNLLRMTNMAERRSFKRASRLEAGFTLVEAMVAVSILALAITGPLLIAQKGVGSAIYARDQITAFYLAQEAIEYIRNVRDTNRITGTNWLQQFNGCKDNDGSGKRCQIDATYSDFTNAQAIKLCPGGICEKLSFYADSVTGEGYYGYGTGGDWKETPYTRTIHIDERAQPDKEALIAVTISWTTNLFAPVRSFTIREYISNF